MKRRREKGDESKETGDGRKEKRVRKKGDERKGPRERRQEIIFEKFST